MKIMSKPDPVKAPAPKPPLPKAPVLQGIPIQNGNVQFGLNLRNNAKIFMDYVFALSNVYNNMSPENAEEMINKYMQEVHLSEIQISINKYNKYQNDNDKVNGESIVTNIRKRKRNDESTQQ